MILASLPHIVCGACRLYALWGLSTLPARSTGQTLDQFRPIWLDLDADLTREGLRLLYILGIEPLRIVDDLSRCSASAQRASANAVILVPPPSTDAHHRVLAVRNAIGPDLGLVVLLRESHVDREVELLAEGADIVLPLDGEPTRERARLTAFTRRLRESVISLLDDDLSLDSRARQAFFEDSRPLPLTDRLFWVLEFLVKHPARVLTPDDFAAMLVAKGIHIQALSIPGLIHRLRRILKKYGISKQIYAVHGRGYRWGGVSNAFLPQQNKAAKYFTVNIEQHCGKAL
ncbi:MAG: winged helix-turn-helix domain-containing protein [Acidithiobacillus sp.]